MKKLILILPLLLFSESFSQEFIFREYRNESKLANQTIFYGIEKPNGMLYFLSKEEFISYDGVKFNKLIDVGTHIHSTPKIVKDELYNLWFLSIAERKELIKFDGNNFEYIELPNEIETIPAFTVSKGKIFLGAPNGVFYFYQNGQWQRNNLPVNFRNASITEIIINNENTFISTDRGMFYYDNFSFSSYQTITSNPVYAFYYDKDKSKAYTLMEKALSIYENGNISIIETDISIKKNSNANFFYINKISDDKFSIGADYSHYVFNEKERNLEHLENVFNIKIIKSKFSFRDSFNNIWITSQLGIAKVSKSLFKNYKRKDGLKEDDVTAIAQFNNGDEILGHKNGITIVKDEEFLTIPIQTPVSGRLPHILNMVVDSKQRIWFSIEYEGVGRINDINNPGNITWFRHKADTKYNTITLLENDNIFLVTGTAFLKLTSDSMKVVHELDSGNQQYFRRLIKLSDSVFVTAGRNGLLFYNHKQNEIKNRVTEVNELYTVCIYKDNLLAGGKSGLYQFKNGKLNNFKGFGREIKEYVYFIKYVAPKDELWIGTNNGLYKWKDNKLKNFQTSEGLADNETNRSAFLFNKKNGDVWIGTIGGLSIYRENLDDLYKTKPVLKIETVSTNNETRGKNFDRLESVDGNVALKFLAISFYNKPGISYETKISGLDSDYSNQFTTVDGTIKVEGLPSGFFELSTSAMDKFGNRSNEVKINLRIKEDNRGANTQVIIASVFIIGIVCVYLVVIWKKKNRLTNSPNREKLDSPVTQTYSINIFGNLKIATPNNELLVKKLPSRSKELLILLLLNSFNGRDAIKGISSEKISKTLWNDSSKQSTKNKRNMAIKRLRDILSENGLGEILFDDDRWILKLNEDISFDYIEWNKFRGKFKDEIFPGQNEIMNFVGIVRKGNFLNDLSYPWVDEIKIWHNNESVHILSRIIRESGLDISLRLEAGKILNSIDPLNETEIKYYIKLLHNHEKLSQAAYIYEQFCDEYENIFGKKYKIGLIDIISGK